MLEFEDVSQPPVSREASYIQILQESQTLPPPPEVIEGIDLSE